MHIAFVIPSLGSGGAERVISVLAKELNNLEHLVSVVMVSNRHLNYNIPATVTIEYLDCDEDQKLSPIRRYLRRLKKIRRCILKISPSAVISFMSETNIDVCLALTGIKIPLIVSERNDPKIDPANKAKQCLRKIAYMKPAGFVFQTADAQHFFSKRIQRNSTIIMNPLSTILPDPYVGIRENRVVAVGRLNVQKNFFLLIDAFAEFVKVFPSYILEIYGEGILYEQLNEYIKSIQLVDKINLKGFCKDVHWQIQKASMFVMTSDFEGMPNALIEAMAIGVPCISTDCPCGGPKSIINSGYNGILFPVGDRTQLIKAMLYIANNPEKGKLLGKNGAKIRRSVRADEITKQWLQFIRECYGG